MSNELKRKKSELRVVTAILAIVSCSLMILAVDSFECHHSLLNFLFSCMGLISLFVSGVIFLAND